QISRLEKNERRIDAVTLQALFIPALGIEKEPEIIRQLLTLATEAAIQSIEDAAEPPHDPPHEPSTNLPRRLTSFVGRAPAIATLTSLIPKTRLVTLTGVGGVGKTSLAAVVGSHLLSAFA